jgi:cobalt-zinc-cadmium efflux system protein
VDLEVVRTFLLGLPNVTQVHDLHVWPLSTTETALTAHLVRTSGSDNAFLQELHHALQERFAISH